MKCKYCDFEIDGNRDSIRIMKWHMNLEHPETYLAIKKYLGGHIGNKTSDENPPNYKTLY